MTEGHQNQGEGCLACYRVLGLIGFLQIKQLKHLFFSSHFGFNQCNPCKLEPSTLLQPRFFNVPTELLSVFSVCLCGLSEGFNDIHCQCKLNSSDVYITFFHFSHM